MREAGLSLSLRWGALWSSRTGALSPDESPLPHAGRFYRALAEVTDDLPIAEFLEAHFADRRYAELRQSITRTVEGYAAAEVGLTADQVQEALIAVAPIIGTARVVSAAGNIARALGFAIAVLDAELSLAEDSED